jgi:hypothetical protein
MARRRRPKRVIEGVEEFLGLQTDVQAQKRTGQSTDQNSDRSVKGLWKVRKGLADSSITDGTDRLDSVGWGHCDPGDKYVFVTSAGDILGGTLPSPAWTSA